MSGRISGLLLLLLGCVLLVLCVPRFLASLMALPGDHVLAEIEKTGRADPRALDTLIASRQSALLFADRASAKADIGLALLLKANAADPITARTLTEQSIVVLEESLRQAPARPRVWTRLAYARYALEGPSAVPGPLHMSFLTGTSLPFDEFLIERMRLALLAIDYLSSEERSMMLHQLRTMWSAAHNETLIMVRAMRAERLLREALAPDKPEELSNFEKESRS